MRHGQAITVIIPALNEEASIGGVLSSLPDWVDEVIVADNGSSDRTATIARECGATVVAEPHRGYGSACLRGIAAARPDGVIVFMDADASDDPADMAALVDPVLQDESDLVIGSRSQGGAQPGAMTPQALFGNWLACTLMRWRWGSRFTDLGPFRAIRRVSLDQLAMADPDYGWTVEMQIKALKAGIRCSEVSVVYRRRIGVSKISGTVRGVIGAGTKILYLIARHGLQPWSSSPQKESRP
jgi:glycosyltransferase involved in cell wall biosynthesis